MPRSMVSGLAAVLALAVIAVGIVQLTGDPVPVRAGSPPLAAHQAGKSTPGERVTLRPGPARAELTAHGDLTRLGPDDQESAMRPAAVSSGKFGRPISYPVDGKIYAQPLYLPGLPIGGRVHDVVIVATEHDSVYAFDGNATTAPGAPQALLWSASLLMPGVSLLKAATDRMGPSSGRLCNSIAPQVGVTSTPVADRSARTIFGMALDVYTGQSRRRAVAVRAVVPGDGIDSVHGQVVFRATKEQQWQALTEEAGTVYAGFGSWCDVPLFHGWLIGFSAATLARTVVYDDSQDAYGGGLGESPAGLTADARGTCSWERSR